jgi:MinD superfamily P-loop ATPase
MRPLELVVLSGKGGAGKTSVAASFAALASRPVIVDCDVDAPNMHLVLHPEVRERGVFRSGWEAAIDASLCGRCGRCLYECRFGAIVRPATRNENWRVDGMFCEGCGACELVCPRHAISLHEAERGEWLQSETRFGPLVHAHMAPGAENSGKLVTLLRRRAQELARHTSAGIIISDGPPGIGCPAIATLSGADHAVFVVEPSPSALHDLRLAVELAARFRIPGSLFINKADLNAEQAEIAAQFAREKGLTLLGSAPYDPAFTDAQMRGLTVVEADSGEPAAQLRHAWERLQETLAKLSKTRFAVTATPSSSNPH